jgi:hypothetical protein
MKQNTAADSRDERPDGNSEQVEPTPRVFRNIHGVPIEPTDDESPAADESMMAPSRRTILRGMAAAGGAAMLPTAAAQEVGDVRPGDSGGVLSPAEGAGAADPYTQTQFRAFADAMVPETPELAERIGDEHRPGGPAVELEKYIIYAFNSFVPAFVEPGGPTNTGLNLRFAEQFALTMDAGATLLVATGRNEDSLNLQQFPLGGPFSKLSQKDRFRAINLLENQDLTIDRDMLLGDTLGLVGGLLGVEEITNGLTEALTPGLSGKAFDSLDSISDELLNSPAGTSLDGLTNQLAEQLADTPTSVGDVIDNLRDQLFAGPFERDGLADKITDIPGFIKFQIMGVNAFSQLGYYSEWSGYGDTKTNCPSNREFNGVESVQSFAQTEYPGPARGYAALRDYPGDLEKGDTYTENEYSTDTSGGSGSDSGSTGDSGSDGGSSGDDGGVIGGLF